MLKNTSSMDMFCLFTQRWQKYSNHYQSLLTTTEHVCDVCVFPVNFRAREWPQVCGQLSSPSIDRSLRVFCSAVNDTKTPKHCGIIWPSSLRTLGTRVGRKWSARLWPLVELNINKIKHVWQEEACRSFHRLDQDWKLCAQASKGMASYG